jgi:hypothetical protein
MVKTHLSIISYKEKCLSVKEDWLNHKSTIKIDGNSRTKAFECDNQDPLTRCQNQKAFSTNFI